ncbi:(R)-1-hydroxy-2-aminoethylphosphonate ammonia-lyase [Zobellia galactanivorans]|uniref:Aminotransferase class-III n=1 Tax=Zobellia galactanivorans (strain DSM 12802 / CCUG 47099 / CIP 106680 / NCIMB 13871 / Dsij) TaxID=63186 RepID=G0L4C3_ZOBGA|nr:aspartate aminotransferase family protein [Zobellia galactanivorans]CAZ95622.1 Aminotransferase class-III [Zobellia galactanivorans]
MHPNKKIKPNKRTEGDINYTPARQAWLDHAIDESTKVLLEKDARYFFHQALSSPCLDVLKNCEGPYIENLSGKKYLDFHGNNVHQLGFSHPKLVQRLTEQLQSLTFSTRRYTNETAINFAEKLASLLPSDLNRTLMTPNGSAAIGIALKLARAVTGKFKVVSFWDSFHGASLDAISVGGESVFREHMGPMMPGVERIPPPVTYRGIYENNESKCLEYLEYVFAKEGDIGAFLAETVRNTDVQVPSKAFWKEARKLCDRYGVLLILDEIPIALGRTGKMFAFEHYNIEPDILCLGKGLGGGIFPQAAIVARDSYNKFSDISLGHYTHEKSPLGAAAALTTLEIIEEEGLLSKVKKDKDFMYQEMNRLQAKHDIIGDVRGLGLLWGIELVKNHTTKKKAIHEAEKVMYECLKNGLSFKVSAGNVLQLAPALTISEDKLKEAIQIVDNSLTSLNL